jgi:hypothetical protein
MPQQNYTDCCYAQNGSPYWPTAAQTWCAAMSAAGKADVRRVTPAAARWVLHQRPSLEFRGGGPLLLGVVALQHSVEVTVDVRP